MSSNISRGTIRTGVSGASQLSAANMNRMNHQQAGTPRGADPVESMLDYQESALRSHYDHAAPTVNNNIHAQQRQQVSYGGGGYDPRDNPRAPSGMSRTYSQSSRYPRTAADNPEASSRLSRRPSVSHVSQRPEAPSNYGPPISYPTGSGIGRRPSIVSRRTDAPSSASRPPPPPRSAMTERTLRPSDSVSNVTSVRNAPSSHAGTHRSHRTATEMNPLPVAKVPRSNITSRTTSTRPAGSRLEHDAQSLREGKADGFPSMSEIGAALSKTGEGGRVGVTVVQQTTRVRETVEVGVGHQAA